MATDVVYLREYRVIEVILVIIKELIDSGWYEGWQCL